MEWRHAHARVSTPLKRSPLPLREGTEGRGAELLHWKDAKRGQAYLL